MNHTKKSYDCKDFIKDLPHAKNFVHNGGLEYYHTVRTKYMLKQIDLKYIYIRLILAILNGPISSLDHNHNINKQLVDDKMIYSRPLRKYGIKNVYERNDTDWQKVRNLVKKNIKLI